MDFPSLTEVDQGVPVGFLGHQVGTYDFSAGAAEFYRRLQDGTLCLPYCSSCELWLHPRRELCSRCLGVELERREVSGHGRVYSFSLLSTTPFDYATHDLPYAVGIVMLEEGVAVFGRIQPAEQARIDARVTVDVAASRQGLVFTLEQEGAPA